MASNRKRRQRNDRTDISLMTILANEATDGSRKLLKKYNRADAKGYKDLEQKLAELYFDTADKVQLEKEMAEIHPHKKFLSKYIEPKVEVVETKIEETTSNADGCCGCESCRQQKRMRNRATCPCALGGNWEQMSNLDGTTQTKQTISAMELIAPIAVIGIITLGFVAVMKLNK